jgi:hypothetical protein
VKYASDMPKYLYILSTEKPFSETDVNRIKDEICRLFECSEVGISSAHVFTLHSPLGPVEVEPRALEVWKRFRLRFNGGGKVN